MNLDELEAKIQKEIDELNSLSPADRINKAKEIFHNAEQTRNKLETLKVQTETHNAMLSKQLQTQKELVQKEFGVDNSADLRQKYEQTMKEYTELSAQLAVVAIEAEKSIMEAEKRFHDAQTALNS